MKDLNVNIATITTVGFFVIAGGLTVVGLTGIADEQYANAVEVFAEVGTFAAGVIGYRLGKTGATNG